MVLIFGFVFTQFFSKNRETDLLKKVYGRHECLFFDEQLFNYGIDFTKKNNEVLNKKVKAVIVPHHLLASGVIADTLKKALRPEIKKIILIGTDHYEQSFSNLTTSNFVWETPFTDVFVNQEIFDKLTEKIYVKNDSKFLENEHSIGGIVPFLAYYSPKVEIFPLIVSSKTEETEMVDLAESLSEIVDDETLIVVSVDFSHYLTSDEAERNDVISRRVMLERDYDKLLTLDSDFVDSPKSLFILLKTLDNLGVRNMEVLQNFNSGDLLGKRDAETTSYFGVVFY